MTSSSSQCQISGVWTPPFSESVHMWELCGCLWGVDTPKADRFSPLFISRPRVLPGWSSLSVIPVLKGNAPRLQWSTFTSQALPGSNTESLRVSPSGGRCDTHFCLHERSKNLKKNCPSAQSPWRACTYFMRKRFVNLGFIPHKDSQWRRAQVLF